MKHFLQVAFSTLTFSVLLSLASTLAEAQDSSPAAAQDNTKVNERDRNKAVPTADQQKENRPDRDISRDIRRSIVQDKSLSTYAHNVKIISSERHGDAQGPSTIGRGKKRNRGQGSGDRR
jgi:hyperosmotically inducible protein